tara:strand:+ start:188 stop:1174 length:987 start_codon:yes stop_codon:yes gene_type:complete
MTQFVPFKSPCDVVDLSVYDNLKLPQYRTVDIVGIQNLPVQDIKFKNKQGQIINLARSTGTDKENVNALLESMVNQGWDITKVPPIVEETDYTLYDGFSRHEGHLKKDHQEAPYLVVKRKERFTVDDVIDEIGLGANNHSQSRKATIVDFKKRFAAFVIRQNENGKEVTTNDGLEWFAAIPNSFNDEKISDAIDDVFSTAKARQNMEAFTKRQAEEKGAELLNLNRSQVFAINKGRSSQSSTYFKRVLFEILDYFDEHGDVPSVVGFLTKIDAEDSEEKRRELEKEVEKYNRVMARVSDLYKRDPHHNFIKLEGFIPQIIDEETDLVR